MPDAYMKYQLSDSRIFFGIRTPAIATVSIFGIVLKITRIENGIENELQINSYRGA